MPNHSESFRVAPYSTALGRTEMATDNRELFEVLKAELKFLEQGAYHHPFRNTWRAQLIFEDSPTCLKYCARNSDRDCKDCPLAPLVPPEARDAPIPCRHIRLNAAGETLNDLYRYQDESEVELTVARWLSAKIAALEKQRTTTQTDATEEMPSSTGDCAAKKRPRAAGG